MEKIRYMQKAAAAVLAGALLFTGCGNSQDSTDVHNDVNGDHNTDSANSVDISSGTQTTLDIDQMFTDRDYEVGYEESESVAIRLENGTASCGSDAVQISGSTVKITEEGTYILSGSTEDGMVVVDADKSDKIQLVLDNVSICSESSAALYVLQADKVFLTLAQDSVNTLSNGGEFQAIDSNNIDAAIFSKEDLTINGRGSLEVTSPGGHGIVSKDDLAVTSGAYKIDAACHALSGKDSVRISDGDFTLISGEDGVHAKNDDDLSLGFCYIAGGTYKITAGDDGIHAEAELMIAGGDIEITESKEGIEGKNIVVSEGDITLTASDDGLNAAGEEGAADTYISISGGKLHINASGDGIDSNGSLTVSGGEVYVSGPVDNGNGALDYQTDAAVTGGVVMAAGSGGMAMNFGQSSTQGTILVSVDAQEAGSTVKLSDSDGTELVSWQPDKEYQSVVVSCPQIKDGATYVLEAGGFQTELTMEGLVYGSGSGMGGGHQRMPGNDGGMPHGKQGSDGEIPHESPDGEVPSEMPHKAPGSDGGIPSERPDTDGKDDADSFRDPENILEDKGQEI